MPDALSIISPSLFVFAIAVTMLGGFVKGALGFALPLVMVSGMGIFLDPQIVVACIILPILTTNILQVVKAGIGLARAVALEHWRFIVVVCAAILVSAQFLLLIPKDMLFIVLGVAVVVLCAVQLAGWQPRLTATWRRPFEWIAGLTAGTIGGLSGTWGPPTVLYLLALDTPRDKQMAVLGVIFGLGSVMLFAGHVQSGVLNAQTWPLSAVLVPPAFIGMWLGFKLGDRIDQARFRTVTLWMLVFAGANLIRRGLLG